MLFEVLTKYNINPKDNQKILLLFVSNDFSFY